MNDPQPNNGTHHRQVLTGARVVHFLDLHLLDLVQAALIAGEIDEGYGVSGQGRPHYSIKSYCFRNSSMTKRKTPLHADGPR